MASELDFPLLKPALISRRQAAGILLAFCIILGGRLIRNVMLVGQGGMWRDNLWLQDAVYAGEDPDNGQRKEKIILTSPLPINTCSLDSLTLLPGVGPVLAGRIGQIRDSGVVFTCLEDLKIVKGIGPAMSARLAPLVIFAHSRPDSLRQKSKSPE